MPSITITEENFDTEVSQSNLPVLVSFWLNSYDGCSEHPFERVSDKLCGMLKFGKININDEPNLAYRYKIRSIPTLLLFRDGRVTDTIVGVTRVDQLMRILQ